MFERREVQLVDCGDSSPRLARSFVRGTLADCGASSVAEHAALLVSEVVTNLVVHPRSTEAQLVVEVRDDAVRVEVRADAPIGSLELDDPTQLGGLGLHIVSLVADHWGIEPVVGGRSVWFDLDTERPVEPVGGPAHLGSVDSTRDHVGHSA